MPEFILYMEIFFLLVMEFGGWVYGLYLCRVLILLETIIHFNAGVTTTSASGRCMEFFFWLVM